VIPDPFQTDGMTLDRRVKDYDLLARIHKQDIASEDQQHHFEAGWEAAMTYYESNLRLADRAQYDEPRDE